MGLVGLLLAPMVARISVDFLNTRYFAMRPRLWLKLMSENQGTISFSPPFGYELAARQVRDRQTLDYDLSAWRVAGVGAEMIRKDSLDRFAARFEPSGFHRGAFLPCYGMAECSLAVSFGLLGKGIQTDCVDADCLAANQKAEPTALPGGSGRVNEFVSCGTPLPGYEIEIRDSCGHVLPERACGALYLRGPSVMSGYFGDAEATRENLTPDGWLNTGDMAYRIGESVLITGRQKDLIIINGRNLWPQDLEYLAERHPDIRTGSVSAFSITESTGEERAVVMVQCREQDTERLRDLRKRLRRSIREELGIDCIIAIVPRNTLIRTTSGKPSRQSAKKVYLEWAAADCRTNTAKHPALRRSDAA
jgi:fatty-acyl-CoA synthase